MISDEHAKIESIIDNLSWLILRHSRLTASEQYSLNHSPDNSDDYIKENKEMVGELRRIRQEFENLVTGLL